MEQFISLESPKQSSGSFILISCMQLFFFVLTCLLTLVGKFYESIPLMAFYYLISSTQKMLIWKTLSKIPNTNVKVTKRDFLLFALLIDLKQAYQFSQCKKINLKQLWMVIYVIQFSSCYFFLFTYLYLDMAQYIRIDFITDIQIKKAILYATSLYIIFGITYGNIIFSQYLAVNSHYPTSIFRRLAQFAYVFSSIFSYIYLFVLSVYETLTGMIIILVLRITFVILYSYIIPKLNIYSRFKFQLLFPFFNPDTLTKFIRNMLRAYVMFGANVDISPTMLKVSNIYDRMTLQPTFVITRIYNTLEIIGLLIYNFFFTSKKINQADFYGISLGIISFYLAMNIIQFIMQIIFKNKKSYETIQQQSHQDIENSQGINGASESVLEQSLIQQDENYQINKINQQIENNKLFIQLLIKTTKLNITKRKNQEQIIQALTSFLVKKNKKKSLIIIQENDLLVDLNKDSFYIYLSNLNVNFISQSLLNCPNLNINKIIISFRDEITEINKLLMMKAFLTHIYSIKKIEFDSIDLNKQLDRDFYGQINSFYADFLSKFLQIKVFYQQLSSTQMYNPYHIIYDLYENF